MWPERACRRCICQAQVWPVRSLTVIPLPIQALLGSPQLFLLSAEQQNKYIEVSDCPCKAQSTRHPELPLQKLSWHVHSWLKASSACDGIPARGAWCEYIYWWLECSVSCCAGGAHFRAAFSCRTRSLASFLSCFSSSLAAAAAAFSSAVFAFARPLQTAPMTMLQDDGNQIDCMVQQDFPQHSLSRKMGQQIR